MLKQFHYVRPRTVEEAVNLLQHPGSAAHAGGTDLLGCMRDGISEVNRVVSLSGIGAMKNIQLRGDGSVEIGALATLAEVAENEMIRKHHTALSDAAASVASPQLRAQGTLGGNLCQRPRCWYFRGDFHCLRKGGDLCYAAAGQNQYHCIFGGDGCYIVHPSDTASALMALNAKLTITGSAGNRTIPIESFFVPPSTDVTRENILKPGEILTSISVPAAIEGTRSVYRKVRERASWDFALAGVAIHMGPGEKADVPRVVLSGVAPVPWRCREVERVLARGALDATAANAAADAAVAGATPLEHNAYKVQLVRGLVLETLLSMM